MTLNEALGPMMSWRVITGDATVVLREMEPESAHCVVTSPPYWGLRDYGVDGQFGLESTPEEYVEKLVEVFREVRLALRKDGTVWLNLGDSYANDGKWGGSTSGMHAKALHGKTSIGRAKQSTNLKPKDLIGIPWRVAFALQADGWYLRSDIIWSKPNPMPESVTDRPTKAHEYVFLLTKAERYFYDAEAVRELAIYEGDMRHLRGDVSKENGGPREDGGSRASTGKPTSGRNKRTVWTIATQPYPEAHFATFPEKLVEPCVLAGCPKGGTVLDPFCGSGTVCVVALRHGRNFVGVELNPDYVAMAERRIENDAPLFNRGTRA